MPPVNIIDITIYINSIVFEASEEGRRRHISTPDNGHRAFPRFDIGQYILTSKGGYQITPTNFFNRFRFLVRYCITVMHKPLRSGRPLYKEQIACNLKVSPLWRFTVLNNTWSCVRVILYACHCSSLASACMLLQ